MTAKQERATRYALLPRGTIGKTKHSVGLPPELTAGMDTRTAMRPARVLLVQEDGAARFLLRYAEDGEFAGDTWHPNDADLESQVVFEYGRVQWLPVPIDVADALDFALESVRHA